MDLFSPRHLLVILLIVLVVFGTKKLRSIGSDLGGAVKGFKKAMNEGDAEGTEAAKQLQKQPGEADAEFPETKAQASAGQATPKDKGPSA